MNTQELNRKANQIRQDLLRALAEAGSGHAGGALGMADIVTALYFEVLHHKPKDPRWPERDRVVLSNGHICPVLYTALAHAGYFPKSTLKTLRKLGSPLQGHPHRPSLPGLETTSGPLGSGLSQAIGMALAARLDGARWRTYCLLSDGEHDEGNTWEAVLYASKEGLGNLTAILDRNGIQIDGETESVLPLESLEEKYVAFGWQVLTIDGHSIPEFIAACAKAQAERARPTLILATTVPGKGVSYMEGDYRWHGSPPGGLETERTPAKEEQLAVAIRELQGELEGQDA